MAKNLCAVGRLAGIEKNIGNSLYSNAVFQHTPKFYFFCIKAIIIEYSSILLYLPHSGISLHIPMHFAILRAKRNYCSH